jgi:signal peptidase I
MVAIFLSGLLLARAAGLAIRRAGWPVTRFEVRDWSMAPTLLPGDRLMVWRWLAAGGTWQLAGRVVVADDPEAVGRFLVKRVGRRSEDGARRYLQLVGDNAAVSRDSRAFGPVPVEAIEGVAIWRYWPAHRRGSLPGRMQT